MGQMLSEPVTVKESSSVADETYLVASSCMQGWRKTMEDAHTHILSLPEDPNCAFFAVYDGHGGDKTSLYAGINLHKIIVNQKEFAEGDIKTAIETGFLKIDELMKEDEDMKRQVSGSTANVILIKDNIIYCGNVGDSRSVVSVKGATVPLSYDHKPSDKKELKRIIDAGGYVEFNRINGNLALSRAFGDFLYKTNAEKPAEEQVVSAFPDVKLEEITPDHEFIVIACDGIWDVLSNEEVVEFVRERFAQKMDPQTICEELLTKCLSPDSQTATLGCDNMTVIIIGLLHGEPQENLFAKCARSTISETNVEKLLAEAVLTDKSTDVQETDLNPVKTADDSEETERAPESFTASADN